MKLFEFANDDPLRVKLVAVVSQLKSRAQDTNSKEPMSTDALLNILKQNEIEIDPGDIYDLIKKDPLVNVIKDIEDDKVIFKGQVGSNFEPSDDESAKTRSAMAKKTLGK